MKQELLTYCFIDASNLFYGGEKVLGWRVDYKKLFHYLGNKYNVAKVLYYGGIEIYNYKYDFTSTQTFPISHLISYLEEILLTMDEKTAEPNTVLLKKHIDRAKFYRKLESFGYILKLKPVKYIREADGQIKKKANCDVDLTLDCLRMQAEYKRIILLSGDGDFEIVLKYFREIGKEVIVLSNPHNTAASIKKTFQKEYRNFYEIKDAIKYTT